MPAMSDPYRDRRIITAALTGAIHAPGMSPYLLFQ
jgi:uncharacterized protein (DUF849 family)